MLYKRIPRDVESSDFLPKLRDAVFDLWFGTDKLAERHVSDSLDSTTTATQTLQLISVPDSTTVHVHSTVIGMSSDRASYEIAGTFYRDGSTAQEGATTVIHSIESDATWNASFDVFENDIRVRISGVALWRCHSTVTFLTN